MFYSTQMAQKDTGGTQIFFYADTAQPIYYICVNLCASVSSVCYIYLHRSAHILASPDEDSCIFF